MTRMHVFGVKSLRPRHLVCRNLTARLTARSAKRAFLGPGAPPHNKWSIKTAPIRTPNPNKYAGPATHLCSNLPGLLTRDKQVQRYGSTVGVCAGGQQPTEFPFHPGAIEVDTN